MALMQISTEKLRRCACRRYYIDLTLLCNILTSSSTRVQWRLVNHGSEAVSLKSDAPFQGLRPAMITQIADLGEISSAARAGSLRSHRDSLTWWVVRSPRKFG
jgi:hypothetical protein